MLAIALTACSTSNDDTALEPEIIDEGMPMHFTSSVATPVTRAANLLHDSHYESFGVWTWKLPSTAPATPQTTDWLSVMEHYRVGYNTQYFGDGRSENGWGYDHEVGAYSSQILKYWDLSCKQYDFKGYAPFAGGVPNSDPHAAIDANNNLHFYNIVGHYPALECETAYPLTSDVKYGTKKNHVDWVYCYGKRTLSPIPDFGSDEKFDKDMTIGETGEYIGDAISKTSTVPLRFHHLLPKVIFRIHVYDPDHLDNEQLVNIGIDIKANTVTKDKDVKYGEVETWGTSGNTNTLDAEYMDHTSSTIPEEAHPTVISFHKEKNTHYRDLSPSIVSTDGSGVVSYTTEGWMELPQYAPVFTINMMADGDPYSRTIDPSVDITFPEKWESDHIYIYIIQFNVKSKTLDTTSYIEEWNEDFDDFELKDW